MAIMRTGFAEIKNRFNPADYLRRIDPEAILDHYGARNRTEMPNKDGHTREIVHSCLIDQVEHHHANGDENPSAAMNLDKATYSCIAPGAWVMTLDGGKPIEDIVVGDMVLTHRGRYRTVNKIYSRDVDEDVIEYRPNGSRSFLITKNHKMLTAPRVSCGSCGNPKKGCRHVPVGAAGWHQGRDIANHVVVRGGLTETRAVDRVRVQDGPVYPNNGLMVEWVDVTPGLMRLVGYYLAEGNADQNGVSFCLNPRESHYADDIELLVKDCFDLATSRTVHRGGLYVRVASRGLARFFKGQFGSGCDQKLLPPWAMTLPRDGQRELLRGLYRGDGSVSDRHQSKLALANPRLVYQVWQILTRFGARMSLSQSPPKPFSIRGHEGMSRPQATILWGDDCSQDFREINDKSKHPFREEWVGGSRQWFAENGEECVAARWREVPYSGAVHDLEVDEDHSFVVEGVVSSNCYSYWSGGIFEFIMKMERKEHLHEIVGLLAQFVGDSTVTTQSSDGFLAELTALLRADPHGARPTVQPRYNERAIAAWTGVRHPYATEDRRLAERAYERLHLGYDAATRRLVFPHYVDGRLVGWQQRAIPDRPGLWPGSVEPEPKYRSNSSFPKSTTLYHGDHRPDPGSPTVVVESPMSVAWAVGQGFDDVVATFGASVPDAQLEVIRERGPLVLWFDRDTAGYKAERRCTEKLMRTNDVRVVVPDPGKDMADYDDIDQVREKIAKAKPAVLRMVDYSRGLR